MFKWKNSGFHILNPHPIHYPLFLFCVLTSVFNTSFQSQSIKACCFALFLIELTVALLQLAVKTPGIFSGRQDSYLALTLVDVIVNFHSH